MSDVWSIEELRQATSGAAQQYKCLEEKRRKLEEKIKVLEENACMEKFVIDKNLLVQILEEENRTHQETVKELEDKISSLEQHTDAPQTFESAATVTSFESLPEISSNIDDNADIEAPAQPEESAVQELREEPKKKRRSFF